MWQAQLLCIFVITGWGGSRRDATWCGNFPSQWYCCAAVQAGPTALWGENLFLK